MVVSTQYPYSLYQYQILASSQDATGDFVSNGAEWVLMAKCRDETTSAQRIPAVDDGIAYIPDAVVYCEVACEVINVGSKVQVRNPNGSIRLAGTCRGFSKDTFHCRLWV